MIIIIDAYNYIKTIKGVSFVDAAAMKGWIEFFEQYTVYRRNKVILVFDAGPDYDALMQRHNDLTVFYSGHQQSADDVIKDWLQKHKAGDVLLVTSDRELRDAASSVDIVSIGSTDFHRIIMPVMAQEEQGHELMVKNIYKTSNISDACDEFDNNLDQLMEEGSRSLVGDKLQVENQVAVRVRNGKKSCRQDVRLLKKINKI